MTAARMPLVDGIEADRLAATPVTPAPRREPTFDDETVDRGPPRPRPGWAAVALPFPPLAGASASGSASRHLAVVPAGGGAAVPATRTAPLPDSTRFGRQFVQAVIEILTGHRLPGQLARSTSAGVQAGLTRERQRANRLGGAGSSPVVHSVRVMEPAEGVAELCAVVQMGRRYRAVAARFEGADGRWRCVRLQIG